MGTGATGTAAATARKRRGGQYRGSEGSARERAGALVAPLVYDGNRPGGRGRMMRFPLNVEPVYGART